MRFETRVSFARNREMIAVFSEEKTEQKLNKLEFSEDPIGTLLSPERA